MYVTTRFFAPLLTFITSKQNISKQNLNMLNESLDFSKPSKTSGTTHTFLTVIVVPTKSDSDVILCLHLLSKTLTYSHHLSIRESIDNLRINPILWIGFKHK